ncbi:43125_t:CDS:2 [Gigaspora margarita]|uniref:43125_t:CDS:1 n=1 Tax=Gigaspora margarita TaxID=4874 RepID=A0ABN7UQW0_GIGMA|nr:43125_t:CDS:2 [Gigaspora margarita]
MQPTIQIEILYRQTRRILRSCRLSVQNLPSRNNPQICLHWNLFNENDNINTIMLEPLDLTNEE